MAAFSEMASVANVDELLQEEANTNMNLFLAHNLNNPYGTVMYQHSKVN